MTKCDIKNLRANIKAMMECISDATIPIKEGTKVGTINLKSGCQYYLFAPITYTLAERYITLVGGNMIAGHHDTGGPSLILLDSIESINLLKLDNLKGG